MAGVKTTTDDYLWGKNIGEGAFARVVHAKRKIAAGVAVVASRTEGSPAEAGIVVVPDVAADSGGDGGDDAAADCVDVKFPDGVVEKLSRASVSVEHLAVKIMEKMHIMKNDKVEYVKQEKNFLAKLSGSKWIIRLLASFQDRDNVYMVMPLAHGGMLHGVIQKRANAQKADGGRGADVACVGDEARFYLAEMVAALRFLHGKGIVHRDLKPENILVMADGHLKLTDFGTALDVAAGSGVKDFVGTPEFVSPEVLKDEPASAAADMWGLGVIVFQLLAGRVPFTAASEWLIFQIILDHCSGAADLVCPPSVADAAGFADAAAAAGGAAATPCGSCGAGTTGGLVAGLLKQDIAARWTLDQVCACCVGACVNACLSSAPLL